MSGMTGTAREDLAQTLVIPRRSAESILAAHLRRLDDGQSDSRAALLAANPESAAELAAFFEVSDLLRKTAEATPATNLHNASTLVGTVGSIERLAAIAQTLDTHVGRSPPKAAPGAKSFGDYELLELIAKGGMGAVYKARQRKLNRIVAVKMILAGQFADQEDIDRFYAEAEAAANLRHPNIVAIHEVGVFEGQHFFSMDYIPGQSLSQLVRTKPLPPKEAAEHVRTIARAMQFAHSQGILHRDLKPSNVLLDKSGEPLITDFGLAKRVTGQSQLTATGAVVGTPSYMPPEQASADAAKVGPASDVYSIGAILYELITGRPPFMAATVMLTIRQVLESEPASPRLLNPNVPRDLETICIKCLQKEPAGRYASAQDLVDELSRFLAGEPIRARPIGALARVGRWCRRNPVVAAFGALAAAGFLAALAASTVGYIKTSAALAESEKSLRQAQETVDRFLTEVSEETLLNQPGMQQLRERLLRQALVHYQRFLKQRGNDPKMRSDVSLAMFNVGRIVEAIGDPDEARLNYEQAANLQRKLVEAQPHKKPPLENLGNTASALGTLCSKLHDQQAALAAFQEAIAVREELLKVDPEDLDAQRLLANSYMNLGLFQFREKGDALAARKEYERAQVLRQAALVKSSDHPELRRDLGKGYYNLATLATAEKQTPDARKNFQLAIGEFERLTSSDPGELANQKLLAQCYRLLADVEDLSGQTEAAFSFYKKAQARLETLTRENPNVLDLQTDLAGVSLNVGDLYLAVNNGAAALVNFERARELLGNLVAGYPQIPQYRHDLAMALLALAEEQIENEERSLARKNLTEALEHLDRLLGDRPTDKLLLADREIVQTALRKASEP